MKICPRCLVTYDDPVEGFCTVDGVRLVELADYDASGGDPMLGRKVAGRFDIVGVIGTGGMGTVYKAIQAEIDRTVALKVLNRELAGSEIPVKRFRREARAASLLSSPHTVTLYEFGEDVDGTLFLAMELLEGEALADRLARRGALPYEEALKVVAQVAESLTEAHDNGIVHRDLKPENVFLAEGVGGREIAKVLDFGIARLTQTEQGPEVGLTHTGMIFGTPGYMSPEQAKGQTVDARSDIYSLGVVLYEMLAGSPPFDADEAVLLMGQHISADVPPIASKPAGAVVPPAVEHLVRRMLVKDPDQRVQNAQELADSLGALLAGELGAPAAPVDVTGRGLASEPPADRAEKRRSLAPIVILGAVVLLAGATLGAALALPGLMRSSAAERGPGQAEAAGLVDASDPVEAMVEIMVKASPPESRIFLDGEAVGGNPYRGLHPRSAEKHRLRIEAPGYLTDERTISFDRERELAIDLHRPPDAGAAAGRGKIRVGKVRPGKQPPDVVITKVPPVKAPTKQVGIDTVPPWGP